VKFTGELATPIAVRPLKRVATLQAIGRGYRSDPPAAELAKATAKAVEMLDALARDMEGDKHEARFEHRLHLLLDTFRIPRDSKDRWRRLAIAMAEEFVPGFRIVNRSGAPRLWSPVALLRLRFEVDHIVESDGVTAMEACRQLLKNPDGTWRYTRCRTARTLYRRYQEAKAKH
jgi:hypothetical protein